MTDVGDLYVDFDGFHSCLEVTCKMKRSDRGILESFLASVNNFSLAAFCLHDTVTCLIEAYLTEDVPNF